MKDSVLVVDDDNTYCKKFCNKANSIAGQKYNFVSFVNLNAVKDFLKDNVVKSIVIPESCVSAVDDIDVSSIFVLNEHHRETKQEGKKVYIYKLQNINSIIDTVDKTISCNTINDKQKGEGYSKLVLFYTPYDLKGKSETIKRLAKMISQDKKILIIEIDEFNNYKGSVGLSNIIFHYKENTLNEQNLRKEIIHENDLDFIKSITYPEDLSVITNIDLANIVNEVRKLPYDYVFVDADSSFLRCQYILNDSNILVICKDREDERIDTFESYLKLEKMIDYKKITEFDFNKKNKAYVTTFIKQSFG